MGKSKLPIDVLYRRVEVGLRVFNRIDLQHITAMYIIALEAVYEFV